MPLYVYRCTCGNELERVQAIDEEAPLCCGKMMVKQPTFPAMVKIKGEGGYPSRRRLVGGTAPYTRSDSAVWQSGDARRRQKIRDELRAES